MFFFGFKQPFSHIFTVSNFRIRNTAGKRNKIKISHPELTTPTTDTLQYSTTTLCSKTTADTTWNVWRQIINITYCTYILKFWRKCCGKWLVFDHFGKKIWQRQEHTLNMHGKNTKIVMFRAVDTLRAFFLSLSSILTRQTNFLIFAQKHYLVPTIEYLWYLLILCSTAPYLDSQTKSSIRIRHLVDGGYGWWWYSRWLCRKKCVLQKGRELSRDVAKNLPLSAIDTIDWAKSKNGPN